MSSDAAKAVYPDLAKKEEAVQQQGKIPKGISAGEAMYGRKEPPKPQMVNLRGRYPITRESLSRVPGLKPKRSK